MIVAGNVGMMSETGVGKVMDVPKWIETRTNDVEKEYVMCIVVCILIYG